MHFIKQAEYTEANLSLHHRSSSCNMGGDHIRGDGICHSGLDPESIFFTLGHTQLLKDSFQRTFERDFRVI